MQKPQLVWFINKNNLLNSSIFLFIIIGSDGQPLSGIIEENSVIFPSFSESQS